MCINIYIYIFVGVSIYLIAIYVWRVVCLFICSGWPDNRSGEAEICDAGVTQAWK